MAPLWVYFHFLEWSKFFATLLTVRVRIWVNVIIRVKVGMLALLGYNSNNNHLTAICPGQPG